MLTTLEYFDVIIKLMVQRFKYSGLSIMSSKWFVRCVCLELLNTESITAPSGPFQIIIGMTKFNYHMCSFHFQLLDFTSE
jgi:hypothetical protein